MRNEMIESGTPLVPVDYIPHLNLLLDALKQQEIFEFQPRALTINVAKIAAQVAHTPYERKNSSKQTSLVPPFAYSMGTKMATVNLEDEQALSTFGKRIEEIRALLLEQANKALSSSTLGSTPLQEYLVGLALPLRKFTALQPDGLRYPFGQEQKLSKRRMHLRSHSTRPTVREIRYRGHKLTISLERATQFADDIIQALCTVMTEQDFSEEEVVETRAVLRRSITAQYC